MSANSTSLSREGFDPRLVRSGPEMDQALAAAQSSGEPIDLVILDLMLPGMSGYEICRRLRESGDQTPVLMLTARGEEADRVLQELIDMMKHDG